MLLIGVIKVNELVLIYQEFKTSDGGFKHNFSIKCRVEVCIEVLWALKGHFSQFKGSRKASKKGCCLSDTLNSIKQ